MSVVARVAIVGPEKVGKSVLANFIADQPTESLIKEYRPTQALRIVEYTPDARHSEVTVQLWDISGNERFEACWPAAVKGLHGVIAVHKRGDADAEASLAPWFKAFIKGAGITSSGCMVVANNFGITDQDTDITGPLSKAKKIEASLEKDADYVRSEISAFIAKIVTIAKEKRDQEENNMLGI